MQTVTDNLKQAGGRLVDGVVTLLGENSPLRDINKPSSDVVIIGAHYAFGELSIKQKRLQSKLIGDHRHFVALIRALLRTQAREVRQRIDQSDKTIREVIEQTHCVWHQTTDQAAGAVRRGVDEMLDAVSCLYDPTEGSVALVPDTNTLIYSPAFQTWEFDGIPEFDIVLVPTLLSELDSLKTDHRNPDVRQKSQRVIRRVKEYRRRGRLTEGVPVVAGRIRLRTVAVEPQLHESLPWLDPTSPDDRMLASFLEVMRIHPRSSVALVTGDINLQNKAEFARVPWLEPPAAGKRQVEPEDDV
jgi:hypothetical protein